MSHLHTSMISSGWKKKKAKNKMVTAKILKTRLHNPVADITALSIFIYRPKLQLQPDTLCLYLFHFMLFELLHLQCYSFPRGNQFLFNSCHLFHFSKRFLSGAEERAAVVEWASTLWNFNNCPICTWLSGGSNPQHNQAETDGTGTAGNSPGIVCTGMWRKLKCENYSE